MFQFPSFPSLRLYIQRRIPAHYDRWVPPFGYLRINGYLLLPAAFRSLSRPSSASGAKASALCSYSLNLLSHSFVKIFWYSSRLLKLKLLPFSFFKKTNFLLISLSLSLFLYSVFMVLIEPRPLGLLVLVENKGFEPLTPCVQGRCSPS